MVRTRTRCRSTREEAPRRSEPPRDEQHGHRRHRRDGDRPARLGRIARAPQDARSHKGHDEGHHTGNDDDEREQEVVARRGLRQEAAEDSGTRTAQPPGARYDERPDPAPGITRATSPGTSATSRPTPVRDSQTS
jgi:hypothetical protein